MVAAYAAVFGAIAVTKFRYYLYIDFDLAIFVQATDQALRGSLYSSIRGMHWLGDHVSLILFVIAPIYALFRHPITLLLLQTVTLALGALPVFGLARRELGHDGIALGCAALYLLHPALGYTNLFEFHPEVLATTTLLATFWAVRAGHMKWTVVFAALSLLCREDVALVILALGLWATLPGRPRRLGVALIALAAVSLVVSFAIVRPAFSSAAVAYGRMYKDWGASIGEVAINVARDPMRAVAALFDTPGDPADGRLKQLYWPHMLAPLLFLPVLSPLRFAIALPVVAEHFLSFRPQQHWLLFQYTALVTPVWVAAAVEGLGRLVRVAGRTRVPAEALRRPGRARTVAFAATGLALVASLACNLLYGPLLRQGWIQVPALPEQNRPTAFDRTQKLYRDRMASRIPPDGGVVAAFEFLARLASRRDVHSIHHLYTGFYTFSTERYPIPTGIAAVLADIGDERLAIYVRPTTADRLRELVAANDLRPADAAGDLVLFLRAPRDTVELVRVGAPEPPGWRRVVYDGQLAFTGAALRESTVAVEGVLPIETTWRRVARADRQYVTQFVLTDGAGQAVFAVARHLGYLLYPLSAWPSDTTVRESYRLVIPASVPPGEYTLGVRVAWWRDNKPALSAPDDTTLAARRLLIDLGRFRVAAGSRR
jgi:uncharacterized membrane protein